MEPLHLRVYHRATNCWGHAYRQVERGEGVYERSGEADVPPHSDEPVRLPRTEAAGSVNDIEMEIPAFEN